MSPPLAEVLQAALGSAYVLERELSGAGMSRVYLATEPGLNRQVVLKVIAPELARGLSAERFRREVQLAAQLQHPNIVPLLSAGEAGELLYYTMPFVAGEPLRDRLAREGELPIPDIIRLLMQVARALSYAHRQGVVHRDIKPGNILLDEDQARIIDFGLARAITGSADEPAITSSGLVLGTPAYMAPEQAAGGSVDGRADLYALGVVAFEMLTGAPPFTGRTSRALLAAHALENPPPVAIRRPSTPRELAELLTRLLEKHPADRPQSADEVLRQLETMRLPAVSQAQDSRRKGARKAAGLAVVGATLIFGGVALHHSRSTETLPAADDHVIAVVPFRVTARDSALGYLREGMLDLLSAKLSGTENLRTVDPRTLLSAWRRAGGTSDRDLDRTRALTMARRLGAGRLLEGMVTGTGDRLVFNATLTSLPSGQEVQAGVEGVSDSLTRLVDELAAQLLALGAGEATDRLSFLTSTSLPALREYLDGRAALRRGAYPESVRRFERAIELDSSFALAGLARTEAAVWIGETYGGSGSLVAWKNRHRLGSRDRSLLAFFLTPNWPQPISNRSFIDIGEAMVKAAPDSPEVLSLLADWVYHYGELTGIPDAMPRSLRDYEQALRLDPTYTPSLEHLAEIRLKLGDTVGARDAVHLRLERDSVSPRAARDRWFGRRVLRDSTIQDRLLVEDSLFADPGEVLRLSITFGGPFGDLDSLLELSRRAASDEHTRAHVQTWTRWYSHARGWPGRALRSTPDARSLTLASKLLYEGLYSDADSALTAHLSAQVPRDFHAPKPNEDPWLILGQFAIAQLELDHGRSQTARGAVRAWLNGPIVMDSAEAVRLTAVAGRLLGTELAVRDRLPDAPRRLQELDSLLQEEITGFPGFEEAGDIVAARLWNEQGDPVRALASVRRRVQGFEGPWLPRSLRDEGRYAALAGDRPGAIKAYRHYLRIRSEAEPALQSEVASVRGELKALEQQRQDR